VKIVENIDFPVCFLSPWMMIAYLLERNRIYGAKFDVDKINAILGLASKIVVGPDARKPYLEVNPNAPVERVYIDISKLIIEESGHLHFLSNVEGQHLRKRKALLPSWVPDFSVQIYKPNDLVFDVWHAQPSRPGSMPIFLGDCMVLFAAEVGQVQEIFEVPWATIENAPGYFAALVLTVSVQMEPVYRFTREPRLEVLLRLLLDLPSNSPLIQPPHRHFDKIFPTFLGLVALIGPHMPLRWGDGKNVHTVTAEQMADVLPGWEHYAMNTEQTRRLVQELFLTRHECIFITDTGYVGKAEKGIKRDDTIAIFERGFVPFVVRRHSRAEQPPLSRFIRFLAELWPPGWRSPILHRLSHFLYSILPAKWRLICAEKYTFIGESYVHGVMRGELITPAFRKTFVPLCLV
jgi:hypothetical protein